MSISFPKKEKEFNANDISLVELIEDKRKVAPKRILLLGSGGREAAIAWKIAQSPRTEQLFIAPGNGGTGCYGTNVPQLNPMDFDGVSSFISEQHIDLLVCGPEDPLVHGLVDFLQEKPEHSELLIVGPAENGARLEGSKDFSKAFMRKHGIPTATYETFGMEEKEEAEEYLDQLTPPFVLKADGLAAGKGVIICDEREEANRALEDLWNGKFGSIGQKVVIEEFLRGIECSVFVATDGEHYKILPVAKDYKRIGEGDTGPNTGGMGAVSPVPFADKTFMQKVEERIVVPTLQGLKEEQIPYCGFLFIGLMNVEGEPYVIEYNCRMGDPETEVVMLRIASDLVDMLEAMALGSLHHYTLEIAPQTAACVMLVSRGYPGEYQKGFEITLPAPTEDIKLFHAGTYCQDDKIVTSGGRVLAISSKGEDLHEALTHCYNTAQQVLFEGKNYRHDIGKDLQ